MDDATHFHVLQPSAAPNDTPGEEIGHGVLGTAFNAGGIGFTATAGGTTCAAGDSFKITVTQSGALNQWLRLNPSATDGSQTAGAIALYPVTTGSGATAQITGITRAAEVKSGVLDWGSLSGGQIAAAEAQLTGIGIITR